MNKTVTVNIGGIVFHIDENAYEKIKHYLESIRSHFTTADGRDEIMQDIEARIAEMFQERVKDSKQVVTLSDVDEVTSLMGRPEQFAGSEEKQKEVESEPEFTGPVKRRLFRNPDDKMLGGVSSGIANYFDVDVVWIRLAFVLLLVGYGSGFWLYIVLWIVIPEAKTAAEKLQMKGEPVTVSNIQKNVREEMEALKKKVDEMSNGGKKRSGTVIGRIFEAIGSIFVFFFKLIGKIIAGAFIFASVIVLIVLFVSFFAVIQVPGIHYPEVLNHIFSSGSQFLFAYFGVLLLIGIPFLLLAYVAAKMIFNFKARSKIVGLTAFGLWILGLILCSAIGIKIARQFSEKENVRKEIALTQPFSKKLILSSTQFRNQEKDYNHGWKMNWDENSDMMVKDSMLLSGDVNLDVVKSDNDSFQLVELFFARGNSGKQAIDNATRINYSFVQTDSLVRFDPFFSLNHGDKYRGHYVQLVLKVPVGASVYFDKSIRRLIYDIENVQNIYDSDMLNRTWKMTAEGLSCVDCTGQEKTIGGVSWDTYDEMNGTVRIHSKGRNGHEVNIDKYGVHIMGSNKVSIDSSGVTVNENGKEIVKINKDGVHINANEQKRKK